MSAQPTDERTIIREVVRAFYPPRRWAVCPNVSWGCLSWEADILAVTPAGTVHEVEVKISKADLLRDLNKTKWGYKWQGLVHADGEVNANAPIRLYVDEYWIAAPREIMDVAISHAQKLGAGLYVFSDDTGCVSSPFACRWKRREKTTREKYQITPESIHRLAALRYWDTLNKTTRGGKHE